jgi:NitT/TauT family transport system ATP-binding protein
MAAEAIVQLKGVSHRYGAVEVLRDLDLTIQRDEFVAIVGPSGCGKTTLLNLMSGFERPVQGDIQRLGTLHTVYQHEGLFPWLTVRENILHGLRHLPSASEREAQLARWLGLVRLAEFGHHYPYQLSGGMRQRAQLARVLAGNADVMLMDEPFSALDYQTRLVMRRELGHALAVRPSTVVLVTHDIEEAVALADRVLVLSARPARIVAEHVLRSARPRPTSHVEVIRTVERIIVELGLAEPPAADVEPLGLKEHHS